MYCLLFLIVVNCKLRIEYIIYIFMRQLFETSIVNVPKQHIIKYMFTKASDLLIHKLNMQVFRYKTQISSNIIFIRHNYVCFYFYT